ncbi:MAG: anti-sigma factor antagonist [Clostridiales bacterium]|nr:anti-sigma factor antagonist [Clostridiales bacterium]
MTNIVEKAFLFALEVHGKQKRKDGKPYIVHPFSVATELSKNGADDELICAGLLHDTIEDGGITPDEIKNKFGEEVLRIVLFDTEVKGLSWKERKRASLDALEHCDRKCAMLLCADKLANIRDVESGLAESGESVWDRFKYGREKQEWLYREYVDRFAVLSDLPMYNELKLTVERVFIKRRRTGMETKMEIKENITYASVEGSINSANAQQFGDAFSQAPGDTDGVVIDAKELEYISSAGLRVLLSLKKRCGDKTFKIVNVNSEVMNIFDVTGFSEIMDIIPASRSISIDGCEVIGRGACGECYRIDDETIIKLYYGDADIDWIEHEKMLSKKAFVMGIPTAISYDIVEANGRKGVVYELIKSKTLGEMIRADNTKLDEYVEKYADICKLIHSIHTNDPEIPSFKEANREDIKNIMWITEEERNSLYRFLDLVPNADTCIHGDLNLNNIMVQNGECCLIDMAELSTGTPMFDVSRILFSMIYAAPENDDYYAFYKMPTATVKEIYEKFFRVYFGCDTVEEAEKINPDVKWLHPLAWFRCCTSMLKGTRWPAEMREKALYLLRNKLIPFVNAQIEN